ncbi:hypothetical protein NDU88_005442 [Pleurodeles waltl]|uniref:Exonuclease domain-containing protein n=1 Tax=Pleurodeles waltl TaxID=8319 RepID=A0AAV7WYK1_PLEWA|nr:hypothetical protein NDU88_005442 [Pleurodeles waltl]
MIFSSVPRDDALRTKKKSVVVFHELGNNFQELERIKKAIEDVKTEVEEEQIKLSLYKKEPKSPETVSASVIDVNENDSSCSSKEEHTSIKDEENETSVTKKLSKTYNSMSNKKYVVDHRCPATDLEYDPLLNYSAGLLCSSKAKVSQNGTRSKRSKALSSESMKSNMNNTLNGSSPIKLKIKLQESDDDDLVIDEPPLQPVLKKPRVMKKCCKPGHGEMNGCVNCSEADGSKNTDKYVEIIQNYQAKLAPISVDGGHGNQCSLVNKELEQNLDLPHVLKGKKHDDESSLMPDNTTCSLVCVRTKIEKEASKKEQLRNESFCPKSEALHKYEEINHAHITNSGDVSALHFQCDVKERAALVQDSTTDCVPVLQAHKGNASGDMISSGIGVPSSQSIFTKNSNVQEVAETEHGKSTVKESEIIVVDSSSEVSDNSEQDIDLSDSDDPMEECLRIFNEFNERELKKETTDQVIVEDHSESDASNSKSTDVEGQKKRIAHPAKFDVKSNKEVLVPLRGPLPQPLTHTRIRQAQEQAAQITAAVKSGQRFVAAAASRHKISRLPTQVHRIGKIVYVNLVDGQPAVSTTRPISRVMQRNPLAVMKPNITQKKGFYPLPAKIPIRRRLSIVPEPGSKVPHEMRQRYVNFFVEEYLKRCPSVHDAFDKALTEEKGIYDRCGSRNMYLNISVNTLKKLRDHNLSSDNVSSSGTNEADASGSKRREEKNDLKGASLYKLLKEYLLSEEQLKENGFPRPNPEKPGSVIVHNGLTKNIVTDALRRVCCRCGEMYAVTSEGKHVRKEECNYHSGKVLRHRVPGGLETRYSCCEAAVGTPGCQVAKLHVHEGQKDNLDGFMTTFKKTPPADGNHGVFSVDCEMCYTSQGLNLTRVTVVDSTLQVIYDTFVKPHNEVIDYNTRFSGVTEDDLKNVTTTIRDVQAIMLNLISSDTILIGHSLENDLFALKLIHDSVIDTSIVFPHRLGLPHKRALRNLMADYLRRIIQDDGKSLY